MEKRRAILKGVKKQIDTDDAFKPKATVVAKAEIAAVKVESGAEKPVVATSGGFLDDLTSFKVE